jgi:tetratricopeptide (TPR) repeat protein
MLVAVLIALWVAPCVAPSQIPPPGSSSPSEETLAKDQEDLRRTEVLKQLIEQNKFREVQPMLLDYLGGHAQSWRAYYFLGYVLFRTNEITRSIVMLNKVLAIKPDHVEAHKVLGLDYVILNKLDQAETEMQKAAAFLPNSPEIRYYLGRIYYTRGAFPLARREFEGTISLDPGYMKAYDNLGLTLEALGNNTAAIDNYFTAIKLIEEKELRSAWPYINLSSLFNRQNSPEQALQYAEKAIEIDPKSDQAYFQMAKAHHAEGDWKREAEAIQKAIQINPDSPQYHYMLSQIYRRVGKAKESQQEMEIFKRLWSSSER